MRGWTEGSNDSLRHLEHQLYMSMMPTRKCQRSPYAHFKKREDS